MTISDRERTEIVDSLDYVFKHSNGIKGKDKVPYAKTLLDGKIRCIQAGIATNVCPLCLGSGELE